MTIIFFMIYFIPHRRNVHQGATIQIGNTSLMDSPIGSSFKFWSSDKMTNALDLELTWLEEATAWFIYIYNNQLY